MTGRVVVLYNPRRQRWSRHFACTDARLIASTHCGRATIDVLNINATHRIELRELLILSGILPQK